MRQYLTISKTPWINNVNELSLPAGDERIGNN